jgi:hypothetical protein
MKLSNLFQTALMLSLFAALSYTSTAHAQGSLTPPGAPAPTMKTLGQIEPRIAIAQTGSPQTLSQSGSYYLTDNLSISTGSILTIAANNVTLDLAGHALTSTDPNDATYAIYLNGNVTNITIVNGFITSGITNDGVTTYGGAGFSCGIFPGGSVYNVHVKGVTISGCRLHGIYLGVNCGTLVENCTVNNVGGLGINADMILDSFVKAGGSSGNVGLFANIVGNCRAYSYGGEALRGAQVVQNCFGASYASYGISGGVVNNSQGTSSLQNGISATVVGNCNGVSANTSGIYTYVGMNSYGTTSAASSYGFYAGFLATDCAGFGNSGIYGYISLVSCAGTTKGGGHLYNTP